MNHPPQQLFFLHHQWKFLISLINWSFIIHQSFFHPPCRLLLHFWIIILHFQWTSPFIHQFFLSSNIMNHLNILHPSIQHHQPFQHPVIHQYSFHPPLNIHPPLFQHQPSPWILIHPYSSINLRIRIPVAFKLPDIITSSFPRFTLSSYNILKLLSVRFYYFLY
jgi:hypothetical protein